MATVLTPAQHDTKTGNVTAGPIIACPACSNPVPLNVAGATRCEGCNRHYNSQGKPYRFDWLKVSNDDDNDLNDFGAVTTRQIIAGHLANLAYQRGKVYNDLQHRKQAILNAVEKLGADFYTDAVETFSQRSQYAASGIKAFRWELVKLKLYTRVK